MSLDNAQIKGIIAACIVGAVILGVFGSGASSLKEKNVNFSEAARTIGRSIMGNKPELNSPKIQGSSSVSDAISDVSSKASSIFSGKSGGSKRNKKGSKRKTKGQNKR